ncbi:MAG: hypothetical protein MZV63_55840 [Marinilabiliales bacterium]|nr:hypothetical protein [Marinilabiliales bacterium]
MRGDNAFGNEAMMAALEAAPAALPVQAASLSKNVKRHIGRLFGAAGLARCRPGLGRPGRGAGLEWLEQQAARGGAAPRAHAARS